MKVFLISGLCAAAIWVIFWVGLAIDVFFVSLPDKVLGDSETVRYVLINYFLMIVPGVAVCAAFFFLLRKMRRNP